MREAAIKFVLIVCVWTTIGFSGTCYSQESTISRIDFTSRMAKVKRGQMKNQVLEIVGTIPEVIIVTDLHPDQRTEGMENWRLAEVWAFGTIAPNGFPSLGQVHFDNTGAVIGISGNRLPAFDSQKIDETNLRRYLELIHTFPAAVGKPWNPKLVIEIVNALLDLEQNEGLDVIIEYTRVAPRTKWFHERIELLLRLLHEIPESPGYFPRAALGGPSFGAPQNPNLIPRFPIHFVGEIPVLLVNEYVVVGQGTNDPTETIEWCRANGKWRVSKLEAKTLSLEEIEEHARQIKQLTSQYLQSPESTRTAKNVYSQLLHIKKKP